MGPGHERETHVLAVADLRQHRAQTIEARLDRLRPSLHEAVGERHEDVARFELQLDFVDPVDAAAERRACVRGDEPQRPSRYSTAGMCPAFATRRRRELGSERAEPAGREVVLGQTTVDDVEMSRSPRAVVDPHLDRDPELVRQRRAPDAVPRDIADDHVDAPGSGPSNASYQSPPTTSSIVAAR